MERIDPINFDDSVEDEHSFPCACGDPECVGDNTDAANINLNGAWYASDCVTAKDHPEVIRDRELDARYDRQRGK